MRNQTNLGHFNVCQRVNNGNTQIQAPFIVDTIVDCKKPLLVYLADFDPMDTRYYKRVNDSFIPIYISAGKLTIILLQTTIYSVYLIKYFRRLRNCTN